MKKGLNIGCGKDYIISDGTIDWVNLDISDKVGADLVGDIEICPWPIPTDIYDFVVANNVLTQISTPKKFLEVMNELHRVTKPTGIIQIRVPNAKDICAWQDPMDCRRFTDQSFTYMQHDHRRYEQYGKHYGFLPFNVVYVEDNGRQIIFKLTPIK